MSIEKMQEEFEAEVLRTQGRNGMLCDLTKNASGEYFSACERSAWWAWQASRAAMLEKQAQEQEDFLAHLADFEQEDTLHG